MSESDLVQRQRAALRDVLRLASERDRAEVEAKEARIARDTAAEQEYRNLKGAIEQRYTTRKDEVNTADEARRRTIEEESRSAEAAAKVEFSKASRKIASEFEARRDQVKAEYQQTAWEINAVHETGERAVTEKATDDKRRLNEANGLLGTLQRVLVELYANSRKMGLSEAARTPQANDYTKLDDPIAHLFDRIHELDIQLDYARKLFVPKLLKGANEVWIYLLVAGILLYPMIQALGITSGLIAAVVGGVGLGFLARTWLVGLASRQLGRTVPPVAQGLTDAEALSQYSRDWISATFKARREELDKQRDGDLNRARKRQAQGIGEAEARRDEQIRQITADNGRKLAAIQQTRRDELAAAIEGHARLLREIENQYRTDSQTLEDRYRKTRDAIRARFETAWSKLESVWREGIDQAHATFTDVARTVAAACADWTAAELPPWTPPAAVPRALRFGDVTLGLAQVPQGVPRDPSLRQGLPERFIVPAVVPFPDRGNLLIESTGAAGRTAAHDLLRAVMLRLLTSLPPAKVRFTIIDPVGLGRSFGAFMHLADFDPALVNQRIWTEPEQIEERLTDLSEHIEKVLQNFLRNEYETIEQYNAQAGEVAEPFRVLVVADFPTHFDERAIRRLANIMASGVRCGVLVLLAVDREKPLPEGVKIDALRPHATNLVWKDDRLVWQDPDFGPYLLVPDALPAPEATNRLLHQAGAEAKRASRVEVPFEFIAPREAQYWTGDSRGGVQIALGKAGATKMQMLDLGKGTSQHALVAGRTGSGKSTLFHALITNLALTYSPDEIELYLIDFKKGVEFKTYATHALPHAQVVAIESEREFGISVLQRLDGVLRERAELFREAGVQDLGGYRSTPGAKPLPRVMFIVDEFQEFFIEDDKLAQEAALLLDRLVRQGRAFGVHVVLGSQTLGGAFSLARSTLGQMAVRIALQCSEADAHLILSEDNSAASMLSRPGEAVYNDANGAPEGNAFFQVCWLDEAHRDGYLNRVNDLVRTRMPGWSRTPIVFEGNQPGQIEVNPLLQTRLEAPSWTPGLRSAVAWLGDAVAIKDPTAASFRRQGGSHLLIVGQNDEAAVGITLGVLASLAAQYPPAASDTEREGARFYVLDGTPEDSSLAGRLVDHAAALPQTAATGAWRDTARILGAVAEEVERRQQSDAEGPEIFLVIHDISRFRDLRKKDDDFGFGRRDEPASPAEQLATILREGPILGVHVLIWCDGLNNLNRTFDRQALRELEQRVLFQMSPTDSSHLIDSPAASRLGPYRALFSNEEEGIQEKFRPYGLPDASWWSRFLHALASRNGRPAGNGTPEPATPASAVDP